MEDVPSSEFDGQEFDAREFVQRYRKRLPLTQLQKVLQAHHKSKRQELVELINEKYQDFVSLSLRMQGVERALKPLKGPLEESSELTESMRSRLGALLGQAQEARKARTQLRTRREALSLYVENAKLLERIRAIVDPQAASNKQEGSDLVRESLENENAARDLRRLRLNLGGKPRGRGGTDPATAVPPHVALGDEALESTFAECRALLAEAAVVEDNFIVTLRDQLRKLVVSSREALEAEESASSTLDSKVSRQELLAVAHFCRALTTLGRADVVEGVFIEVFVKEALSKGASACSAAAEDGAKKVGDGAASAVSVGTGAVDLRPFFDSVTSALLTDSSLLLWFARRLRGEGTPGSADSAGAQVEDALLAVPSLNLVSQAIAVSVAEYVQTTWPQVFMPAFPDVFAANYGHAQRFLKRAESFMTLAERQAFPHCGPIVEFQKRWKSQVYSSMRNKEAMKRLEAAPVKHMDTKDGGVSAEPRYTFGEKRYWLGVTLELMQLLQLAWGDKWYLEAIFSKMVQLSLELLAKHGKLVTAILPPSEDKGGAPPSVWEATASPPCWSTSSAVVRLPRFVADMLAVAEEVKYTPSEGSIAKLILSKAPEAGGDKAKDLLKQLLQETFDTLRQSAEALGSSVVQQVSAVVLPQFAAIRGIPAFYRMLNKPVPEVASPYVPAAMAPIEAFQKTALGSAPQEVVKGWLSSIVDAVAVEFAQQSVQLLESTKQQEASLRRLSGRAAAGDSQVSDLEKIHIQLCLDIDTFKKSAAGLGASMDLEGLQKLTEAVAQVWPTYLQHRPSSAT
mmetsp:Transcript_52684/g.125873  ORF Transcript_52684/g.125873 Transcript_52684/m.125873 type:complete len:797 (-) Transcript_52684:36-2426(-)